MALSLVKGDTIVAVGPRSELEAKYSASQTIDAKGKLVLPGFINGHTHVPMTLFRGLHDDVTLNDWLYKYIFPAEAKNVNEEFVRWGTRLAAAEQIRGGVTTFADMYYFEDAVAEETKAAGMRGVLGETFIDFPAPDNKSEAEMLAYTEKFLKKWQGDPLIHAAVAPHSIYTCSQKTLQDAAALARKYHAPILIHTAEMKKEWEDSQKQNGMSPVQYLDKIGIARSGRGIRALHLRGRSRPQDAGATASGLRAQPVEQHDDCQRRLSGRRNARRGSSRRTGHRRARRKQQ